MITKPNRNAVRKRIHGRVRSKIRGTDSRPRLNVFRSNKNIYAQLIDDDKGITIVSANSNEKGSDNGSGSNVTAAEKVGKALAERAVEKGYKQVVFDRGGYVYHGRVKALAEAARESGLEF